MLFRSILSKKITFIAVVISTFLWMSGGLVYSYEYISPKTSGDRIILENDLVSYVIGTNGANLSFTDRGSGKDYLDKNLNSKFMSINIGK